MHAITVLLGEDKDSDATHELLLGDALWLLLGARQPLCRGPHQTSVLKP